MHEELLESFKVSFLCLPAAVASNSSYKNTFVPPQVLVIIITYHHTWWHSVHKTRITTTHISVPTMALEATLHTSIEILTVVSLSPPSTLMTTCRGSQFSFLTHLFLLTLTHLSAGMEHPEQQSPICPSFSSM